MIISSPTMQYHSKNIYHSFTHKMDAKGSWHRNYVTVILCISWSYDNESNKLKESKQISETRTHVELYDGHIGDEDVMSGDATFAKFSDITETHRRHA